MKKVLLSGALLAAMLAPASSQAQGRHRANDNDRPTTRDDWHRWRDSHRDAYRRGDWRAPFPYRSFNEGMRAPSRFWTTRTALGNWSAYHLPPPANRYFRYYRHYDDVLLIDVRSGQVIRVFRGFYW